jgi:diguanylate cyclase (GGDEF)-like protein
MLLSPIPIDEQERLQALHDLKILETPINEAFERITRLAKRIFNVPIATISLIDEKRQWLKSVQGLNACETSRDTAICSHTILQDDIFVVHDTLEDDRFRNNPFVVGDPGIRFYAGYPLWTQSNQKIGTLCIVDQTPRSFILEDFDVLRDLAGIVQSELRQHSLSQAQKNLIAEMDILRLASMVDPLTRLWNRNGIDKILNYQIKESMETNTKFGIALVDIDFFKSINDNYGHLVGDETLQTVAKVMLKSCRLQDAIGRWGGEEFLIIILAQHEKEIKTICERIRSRVEKEIIEATRLQKFSVTLTMGVSIFSPDESFTKNKLIGLADNALYEGKQNGRNQVIVSGE